MTTPHDIAAVIGLLLIGYGVYLIYTPLVWVFAGAALLVVAGASVWRNVNDGST